ncbi:Uma2 family endonuclease [Rugosimonospora africana]|uniref:Restriction endonuclease domain-containing protein n=1 Tax=Rugosimonospora africana TaxID=556532 RepID=A0A8J3QMI9_9ACTN|nr:Uma2 family endonuclease [Rugosimonospora africana]GIH12649.1 hypothetical protein Raf01_08210 [Rugosimonospora africana]
MTSAFVLERPEAWTEERYFALGETNAGVELFDESLLVSPAPTVRHQDLSALLREAMLPGAKAVGLRVYLAVNVRLKPGRVPIPDHRVLKMHYYAVAGIPWYLLVGSDPVTLTLYRLDGDHYVQHASAKPGETLTLTEPVAAELDTAALDSELDA